MSKRKLSIDDKREKLLELFHETSDVFQLRDLERIAPKEKGIVPQFIRATLQELVDSGNVCTDQIAGNVYYWSFQSKNLADIKRQLTHIEEESDYLDEKIQLANQQLASAERTPKDAELAAKMEEDIKILQKDKAELEQEAENTLSAVEFTVLVSTIMEMRGLLKAVNRWTLNVLNIKSWCIKKFHKQEDEVNKLFGIPEQFRYVSLKK